MPSWSVPPRRKNFGRRFALTVTATSSAGVRGTWLVLKLFNAYCSCAVGAAAQGKPRRGLTLDVRGFLRILEESRVLDGMLTPSAAEIIFDKAKLPTVGTMNFEGFMGALYCVADAKSVPAPRLVRHFADNPGPWTLH
ncbi:hypothetical protein CYMTET_11222 [Cymbomonas tetramitiformis]|uniref:Uncharacterized protein n=1 Tax=Cymbomonas tetramitiformis TaxID=36881 RepID=A0AAE0GMW5_9CHLO|nr:hypothetical protein CYMTET_11222 [Cymbomonas tetramitiformis]